MASTTPAKSEPSTAFRGARSPKARRANHGVPDRAALSDEPIDTACTPDAHLTFARARIGPFDDADDLGRSVPFVHCDSHDAAPCRSSGYWKTSSSGTPNTRAIWKAISSEGE